MNIFVLHLDPRICSHYHCDKHVVKMILEYTQLLYTCLWLHCPNMTDILLDAPYTLNNTQGYKCTHKNHPCTKWLEKSIHNYEWLVNLANELCKEYEHRYNKIHSCKIHIDWCSTHCPDIPDIPITPHNLVMPDQYKTNNTMESYRNYYISDKQHIAKWTKRHKPKWFINI